MGDIIRSCEQESFGIGSIRAVEAAKDCQKPYCRTASKHSEEGGTGSLDEEQAFLKRGAIRNLVATLRMMWNSARAWGYVAHDPFDGLRLPSRGLVQTFMLSLAEIRLVIDSASEPYKTLYRILAETGIRGGRILCPSCQRPRLGESADSGPSECVGRPDSDGKVP